jgi:tetratricopeptide (TPR) repeat protein
MSLKSGKLHFRATARRGFSPLPERQGSRQQGKACNRANPHFRRRLSFLFAGLLFLFLPGQELYAQGTGGTISGTLREASGAWLAAAKVNLTNERTSSTQSTLSSADGKFTFAPLAAGIYTLSVDSQGFQKVSRAHIEVKAQQQTVVEFTLTPIQPGRAAMDSQASNPEQLPSHPAYYDEPLLKPSAFKDSVDAGGYSSEGQAQTSKRLLQGVAGLKEDSAAAGTRPAGKGVPLDNEAFKQATLKLKQAVALRPDSFEANHQFGELYIRAGKLSAGIPYLQKAQRLDPSHYGNSYDLALAYLETAHLAQARSQIQQMLRRQDNAELHNLLGEVEEGAGNFVAAAQEYQRAAHQEPNEKYIFDWGNELLRHRAYEPAVEVFAHGVARYPRSARLHIGLGIALYSRGQYDDAVDALLLATDLEPADPRPYLFLGRVFDISTPKAEEVTKRLERFVQLQPTNGLGRYYYAMSLWKGQRTQNAQADLTQIKSLLKSAATLHPTFPDAHLQLGNLYAGEKKFPEAIREYRQAVKVQPDLAEAHYRLAQAYARIGEKERAQEESELHDRLHKQQMAEDERKQKEAGQFLYTIKDH